MLKMIFSRSRIGARRLLPSVSGNVAVSTALLVIPLFLSLGVALDYSRLSKIEVQMQDAADAAALAAAGLEEDLSRKELQRFVAKYFKANGGEAIAEEKTRVRGHYRVRKVVVRAKVNAGLKVLGHFLPEGGTVSVLSVASKSAPRIEMAMVLDVTGSMEIADTWERTSNAVQQVLEELEDNTPARNFYISLIPYTDRVNIGRNRLNWLRTDVRRDANFDRNNWNGCVEPLEAPTASHPYNMDLGQPLRSFTPTMPGFMSGRPDRLGEEDSPCGPQITGPTRSLSTFMNAFRSVEPVGGTGRFDDALTWGWRAVSNNYRGRWGAGRNYPSAPGESTKIVTWFTDARTEIHADELDQKAGEFGFNMGSKTLFENVSEVCRRMKEEDIIVFIFHVIGNEHASPWFRECAEENYFAIRRVEEFETALQQLKSVGQKLRLLR